MGRPIARRLLQSGYKVMVYNRDRRKSEALVEDGATVAKKLSQLAFHSDVILSCLVNDDAVRNVYMGPEGIFANVRRGSVDLEDGGRAAGADAGDGSDLSDQHGGSSRI
jgi:3-hydroxyisobutyrate dehydrogenase